MFKYLTLQKSKKMRDKRDITLTVSLSDSWSYAAGTINILLN